MEENRALSDVVAFTLMFAIIILSVAAVSTAGVDQLSTLRDREKIQSAERGMKAFATTVEDIYRNGDPVRAAELSVGDGSLLVRNTSLWIRVDGDVVFDDNISALEHRFHRPSRDVALIYEGGGVFNSNGASAAFAPPLRCSNSRDIAIVTVVNLTTPEPIHLRGSYQKQPNIGPQEIPSNAPGDIEDPVRLIAQYSPDHSNLLRFSSTGGPVVINVSETATPDQWRRYLNSTGWKPTSFPNAAPEDEDYLFKCDAETVLIRNTTIQLSR